MDETSEEWRYIEEFPKYQISNLGRVRSFAKGKRGEVLKFRDKWYGGYAKVQLYCNDSKGKSCSVHRLVAKAFIPNPENKPMINHIDGNKLNNNFTNLEWVTNAENIKHAFKTGLEVAPKGEKHPMHKLTEIEVIQIYKLAHRTKKQGKIIGSKYGISNITVSDIKRGKNWNYLTKGINELNS